MKCDGIDCLHCTIPARKCRGCQRNAHTPRNGTQPTRKAPGVNDKTAVHLSTREDKTR